MYRCGLIAQNSLRIRNNWRSIGQGLYLQPLGRRENLFGIKLFYPKSFVKKLILCYYEYFKESQSNHLSF